MLRRLALPLVALFAALALAPSAHAAIAYGVGDQSPNMFGNASYQALKLKKTRYFIHWDAADKPAERRKADAFVKAAKAAKVKVLMHISTNDLREKKGKLPSVKQYRSKVGKLVKRYKKQGVRDWGVWNEANHKTQPTWNNPKRAAQFYVEMKKLCKGCTIVALDVLDQPGFERYIQRWGAAAGSAGRSAKIIGIHNYSEVNRRRTSATTGIIKSVRKFNKTAKFWYTETGGLARFEAKGLDTYDLDRQADRTQYMFDLARKFRADITRLYSYNVAGTDGAGRFDAGLLNANGTPRPAYDVVKSNLAKSPFIR
ncbi:MAG: hypothetical protein JHC95_04860 [Solirubrobacteraceae bacterium]|nr:hypothetical protein [Solirubrobacteraceae bacterium]